MYTRSVDSSVMCPLKSRINSKSLRSSGEEFDSKSFLGIRSGCNIEMMYIKKRASEFNVSRRFRIISFMGIDQTPSPGALFVVSAASAIVVRTELSM